jgi:hypothetical protein
MDSSCNQCTPWVANNEYFCLILYYPFNCNLTIARVAINLHSSCKHRVLPSDTIPPLQLQPDSCSSCNRCKLQVANTECFRITRYHPFSCNWTVVQVAIDVHSELQILSASAWYCTTPSVATRQWFELQSMYTPSCKYWVVPLLPNTNTVLPL